MSSSPQTDEQALVDHLGVLRQCLIKALTCVALVFLCGIGFANDIYRYVALPLIDRLPADSSLIATGIAAPFLVPVKMTFFAALFLSAPYVLHQCWSFVAPGLYRDERRAAVKLLLSSIVLFYLGCAFAYFLVLPLVFGFFSAFAADSVQVMPDIQHHLRFSLTLFFAFGLAFEIPVATYILVRGDWISRETLQRNRPWIIVLAFALGMVLTPPDVLSQILLAVPVWLLFELGLLLSR